MALNQIKIMSEESTALTWKEINSTENVHYQIDNKMQYKRNGF